MLPKTIALPMLCLLAIAGFSQANPNNTPAKTYLPGVNGQDYFGYVPYFEASRKQFIGKASATWDATEKLNFTLGGKYTNDTYPNSTYLADANAMVKELRNKIEKKAFENAKQELERNVKLFSQEAIAKTELIASELNFKNTKKEF